MADTSPSALPPEPSPAQRRARRAAILSGWKTFSLRDAWWKLLDAWEERKGVRITLTTVLAAAILSGVWFFLVGPWWSRRNALHEARVWLQAGKWRYAAEAAEKAAQVDPTNPEPWQIAAELARRGGQKDKALDYSRRAAGLAPQDPMIILGWAADALKAEKVDEARRALATMAPDLQAKSAHAQRLLGEIARREQNFSAAERNFETALKLEGPLAINEVPLGLILTRAKDPGVRQRGMSLLAKWSADREWGATALRALLADALEHDDRTILRQRADALLAHPSHTVGDMPRLLHAYAMADTARYQEVLAQLERDHATTPQGALQLLGWLNQIGRSADAVRWMETLPPAALRRPPLAVLAAEAKRATGDWSGLQAAIEHQDWGAEAEFLRWCYALVAARQLGQTQQADTLWRSLQGEAHLNSVHAMFAASTLYAWGVNTEAEALWWQTSEQDGPAALDALGALARHYQTRRNAEGQWRVFRRLHLLRPDERAIANNFAFFSLLTGHNERQAEQLARANYEAAPDDVYLLATYAFALSRRGDAKQALALLQPHAARAAKSPVLAFAYGLALAHAGRIEEARPLLTALPESTLTEEEVAVIQRALSG